MIRLVTLAFNSTRFMPMVNFYRALGAELSETPVRKGGVSYQGQLGNLTLSFYNVDKAAKSPSPNFAMRLEVDQLDEVMARVRDLEGVEVLMDCEMLPDGKQSILLDPDGHSLELVEVWKQG